MNRYLDAFITTLSRHYREYIAWLDSWGASIYIFAPNRDTLYCNENAEALYGYTRLESIGQNGTKLLMEEQYYSIGDEATAKTASFQCCNGVFPVINKSGQPFKVVAVNTPFFTDDGLLFRGVICASVDARGYTGSLQSSPQYSHRDFVSLLIQLHQQQQPSNVNNNRSRPLQITNADGIVEIPRQELTIDREIGRGEFGVVYQGRWKEMDVAIKVFSSEHFRGKYHSFKNEVSIMKDLKDPNVVELMGVLISPDDLSLITAFLPRGSLFQLLHINKVKFSWRRRIRIALDIAQGMNYLHSCQPPIIHCDLKSPNLLVTNDWTVKVSDFGLAFRKTEKDITRNYVGTPQWAAPETLCWKINDEKSDVYSYGVVLWELVTERIPWEGIGYNQVVVIKMRKGCLEIPRDLDPRWGSIIERCWQWDPERRPTFDELVKELRSLQYGTGDASTSQG